MPRDYSTALAADLGQRAAALLAMSKAATMGYKRSCKTEFFTLAALNSAVSAASLAAQDLAEIAETALPPVSYEAAIVEIQAVETLMARIDIERVKTDAAYAAGLKAEADLAEESGEAALDFTVALKTLLTSFIACGEAKSKRDAIG